MTRQDLLKFGIFLDQESGGLLGNAFLQAATDKYMDNNLESAANKLNIEAPACSDDFDVQNFEMAKQVFEKEEGRKPNMNSNDMNVVAILETGIKHVRLNSLTREDIRNKLSPMANLIAMLKTSEYVYHHESAVHKLIEAEIGTVEQNISYLSGEIK